MGKGFYFIKKLKVMPSKVSTTTKAKNTASKVNKPLSKASHKVHKKPRFFRPKTKSLRRTPKLVRRLKQLVPTRHFSDNLHDILVHPITSDKNAQKMETENTLTFIVNDRANKSMIKEAFQKLYSVKVRSVNTLNRPDGKKKAYIRLAPGSDALKVASKVGIL